MTVDEFLARFASLTGDAVALGFRRPEDEEAVMVWANDAFARLFGYSPQDWRNQSVSFILHPDHKAEFFESVVPAFEAGDQHINGQTYCLTADGRKIFTSISLTVTATEEGRYSAAIFRDISKLKEH